MKKYLYPAIILFSFVIATYNVNAEETNLIPQEGVSAQEKAGHKMFKGMHKNHKAKKKHHDKKEHHKDLKPMKFPFYANPIMQCKMEDLSGEYQDILSEIASSSMSQDARKLLSLQAEETYNLSLKQMRERMELRAKQACARMPYRCELFTDAQNRKILRNIEVVRNNIKDDKVVEELDELVQKIGERKDNTKS